MSVLITTIPFGQRDRRPLDLLENSGIEYRINPLGKKLTEDELLDLIGNTRVLIAGTERISERVMRNAPKLELISRVGIGLDGVDLLYAERAGIKVSYTPDAPAPAVSELTIGLMVALLRSLHISNSQLHMGGWRRVFGRRLAESTVGIIGVGRIGKGVRRHLTGFGCKRILVNDLRSDIVLENPEGVEWVEKEQIYREADVITIHVPLTSLTKGMIRRTDLERMKEDACLINTARGGIINEDDLLVVLRAGHLGGVALDVFDEEPYSGPLAEEERCLLTAHMGSMSVDCRTRMEKEATEEAVRFLTGKPLEQEVPPEEYDVQRMGL